MESSSQANSSPSGTGMLRHMSSPVNTSLYSLRKASAVTPLATSARTSSGLGQISLSMTGFPSESSPMGSL